MFAISKTIHIQASPVVIFNALTSSELIPQYYSLKAVASEWQINGTAFTDFARSSELLRFLVYLEKHD